MEEAEEEEMVLLEEAEEEEAVEGLREQVKQARHPHLRARHPQLRVRHPRSLKIRRRHPPDPRWRGIHLTRSLFGGGEDFPRDYRRRANCSEA